MAKVMVLYTILTTAFVILILLPPSSKSHNNSRHIRFIEGTHFDPIVTKFEHKTEKNGSNVHSNVDSNRNDDNVSSDYVLQVKEAEIEEVDKVYFGKDGKLNLRLRLTILFPMIDNLPNDGYVEFKELEAWNIMQANQELEYATRKKFEDHDTNKDGLLSFNELFPHFSHQHIEENKMGRGDYGWWMEQFTNADADQDTHLTLEELKDFLHPGDCSKNVKVQEWFMHEKIRRLDSDNDGRLNLKEFVDNAYETIKSYYEFSSADGHLLSHQSQFSNLDSNNDRFLTIQELKPIKKYLFPGVLDHASYYAIYLMNEVDDNHDKKLSIDEILNHQDKFYKSVYVGDLEDDDYDHHEF